MSKRVEETVKSEKKLNPNVDFYSASAYYSLGIPIDLFTPIFAVSRMSGWTAHILEQYHNNRLIRPRAEYKGNADGMPGLRSAPDNNSSLLRSAVSWFSWMNANFLQSRRPKSLRL